MIRDYSKCFIQQQMFGRADLGMDEDQSVSNGPWASSVGKCRVHSTVQKYEITLT